MPDNPYAMIACFLYFKTLILIPFISMGVIAAVDSRIFPIEYDQSLDVLIGQSRHMVRIAGRIGMTAFFIALLWFACFPGKLPLAIIASYLYMIAFAIRTIAGVRSNVIYSRGQYWWMRISQGISMLLAVYCSTHAIVIAGTMNNPQSIQKLMEKPASLITTIMVLAALFMGLLMLFQDPIIAKHLKMDDQGTPGEDDPQHGKEAGPKVDAGTSAISEKDGRVGGKP